MTTIQRQRYNALLWRKEQLTNFLYLADLPLISDNNGNLCSIKDFLVLEAATGIAERTVTEIDNELARLLRDHVF